MELSLSLVEKGISLNRRSLDLLLGKIFFNYSNCAEALQKLEEIRRFVFELYRLLLSHPQSLPFSFIDCSWFLSLKASC